jgi:hypothetical protein
MGEFGPVQRIWIRGWLCWFGLHILVWSDWCDGYLCACKRYHLWSEEIRDGI